MLPGRNLRAGFLILRGRCGGATSHPALHTLHDPDLIHGAGHCLQIVFSMNRALEPCISAWSLALRAGDAAAPLLSVRAPWKAEGPVPAMSSTPPIDPPPPSPAAIFSAGWRAPTKASRDNLTVVLNGYFESPL
jgi:hypothetical protein